MLDTTKVWELCNHFRWYTCGTNTEYDNMFKMVREKRPLMEIADDIYCHSELKNCSCVGAAYQELSKFAD